MKVSIIIPVYNSGKYLQECLDSIVNQTLRDIEIICVNDGSTDNSLEILETYAQKDSRIKLLNQKNKGVAQARNLGLEHATGEYVAFVDSDDYVDLDLYEKCYDYITKQNAQILIFDVQPVLNKVFLPRVFFDTGGYFNINEQNLYTYKDIKDVMFEKCWNLYNKFYNRKFLEKNKIRFFNVSYAEDAVFCIEALLESESITSLEGVRYYYRRENESSLTHKKQDLGELLLLFQYVDKILSDTNNTEFLEKEVYQMKLKLLYFANATKITNINKYKKELKILLDKDKNFLCKLDEDKKLIYYKIMDDIFLSDFAKQYRKIKLIWKML